MICKPIKSILQTWRRHPHTIRIPVVNQPRSGLGTYPMPSYSSLLRNIAPPKAGLMRLAYPSPPPRIDCLSTMQSIRCGRIVYAWIVLRRCHGLRQTAPHLGRQPLFIEPPCLKEMGHPTASKAICASMGLVLPGEKEYAIEDADGV